jgi:hypothetical protein
MSTSLERRRREERNAKEFWDHLSTAERWTLGDHLVWGCFDYDAWGFDSEPSSTFMNALDRIRINWEDMLEP